MAILQSATTFFLSRRVLIDMNNTNKEKLIIL